MKNYKPILLYRSFPELDKILEEYYHLRGWNKNGIPTEEKLEE